MTKYLSFQEYGQESELAQIAEGKCPRIDASGLPCITKVNHMVNDLGKLLPIMEYVDETLFERRYGRIAHIMKLPVQAAAIKALLNFWDPSYRCFTFGNIDMTPTLEEYERILDFPNDNCRIYHRRRFEDTASEVVSLLGLGKISQCRVAEGGFKWKIIEARMKKNAEEGKLGDERYRLVAFAIFGLVLFPSEIGVISLEAASVFIEYEHDRINPSSAILGETMLSLNHCRTHGKGAMRCCVPMLYLWIISHIEAPRDIFNNFWWFDLRPLKITIDETWKNWDEKAWRDKYAALPSSNFKWKAPWMNNAICTMSCGSKIWVPLIGVTGYISYAPALVTRQLGGMQYTPRTLGLADFIGLFKHQPFIKEMELIRQDWERPVKVKREEGSSFETSFSHNYTVWRNEDFSEVKGLSTQEQSDASIETQKRKRKDDEEDLRRQLDQCVIELSKSKGRQQLLENQLEEENTMRVFLNQRLEKQEKQLMSLKEWQKRAEVAEDITTGVQAELRNRIADYDELVKKNGIAEKELAKVKRATKGVNDDKETMDSLKKGRKLLLKKIEVEKEKNRLANLDIEEERKVRAQYMVQIEEERNARMAAESDMRDYQKRSESSKGRMRALQAESEVREEELRELRSHYCEMEEDMSKAKQERQECQDYMDSFAVQINSKIAELDIAKEELQRTRDKLAQSEGMVRVLERSNEALGASNEAIIEDNTVFHAKIRHMEKQVEQVARYAERLQQQATQVGNDASKYREYMGAMAGFIGDLANRGNAF